MVVAGLPGAGKTTLVAGEPRALDSDAVREAWAPRLRGIPYALWRPLAHAWHWLVLWRALGRQEGVIVVRPFTSARARRAVLRRARRRHDAVHLVVVEATPAQARAGQLARGRTVAGRAMERHVRRWIGAGLEHEGWTTVLRLTRDSQRSLSPLPAVSRVTGRASKQSNHPGGTASMLPTVRKTTAAVAALGAFAMGGAAIAGAADKSGSSQTRPQREALASSVAAKVKAAALAKLPGATVLRTEAGGPYGTAYHAHVKTSDGTRKVVLVDKDFNATEVQADRGRGAGRGRGDHGGGPGAGETALTGATKEKVEAAVLAEYSGATIVRTETNGDSSAPYESHITTSAGKELEVLVGKDFKVVDAREHPARP